MKDKVIKMEDGARNILKKHGKGLSNEEAGHQWRLHQAEKLMKELGFEKCGDGWKVPPKVKSKMKGEK